MSNEAKNLPDLIGKTCYDFDESVDKKNENLLGSSGYDIDSQYMFDDNESFNSVSNFQDSLNRNIL